LRRALQVRGPSPRTKRRERTCSLSFAPLSKPWAPGHRGRRPSFRWGVTAGILASPELQVSERGCLRSRSSRSIEVGGTPIPHSGTLWVFGYPLGVPHFTWIPHSEFRIPHWVKTLNLEPFVHSAFRTPHSALEQSIRTLVPSYALRCDVHSAFRIPHSAFDWYLAPQPGRGDSKLSKPDPEL
jgi:hypothetical protein